MTKDELYIKRCIDLAKKGLKSVAPNPMVGCVIVLDNKIIGEGYHIKYGEAHAEVNAIQQVKDKTLLERATLYVSLEPCTHFGKTPPCCDLILKYNIPHVVIGCIDPFDKVAGKGVEKLRKNGVKVDVGILEKEALKLNKRFFTFHQNKRPYVILKWAETQDGFIDRVRIDKKGEVNWITSPKTKQLTDTWRSEEMAILVGKNTVLNDNPNLTVRTILGKSPVRLIIDKNNELPSHSLIFDKKQKTVVFNALKNTTSKNLEFVQLPFKNTLTEIFEWLHRQNILSLFVEGGAYTIQQFIDQNVWDEARIYRGNTFFNEGVKSPKINVASNNFETYGEDSITSLENKYD